MTVTEHIRDHFLRRLGVVSANPFRPPHAALRLEGLRATEWSEEFEAFMRARLLMGAYRYAPIGAEGKPEYSRTESIRRRLALYERTGNLEALVDAANLCMLEFVEGRHPLRHFHAVDDGEHTQVKGPQ